MSRPGFSTMKWQFPTMPDGRVGSCGTIPKTLRIDLRSITQMLSSSCWHELTVWQDRSRRSLSGSKNIKMTATSFQVQIWLSSLSLTSTGNHVKYNTSATQISSAITTSKNVSEALTVTVLITTLTWRAGHSFSGGARSPSTQYAQSVHSGDEDESNIKFWCCEGDRDTEKLLWHLVLEEPLAVDLAYAVECILLWDQWLWFEQGACREIVQASWLSKHLLDINGHPLLTNWCRD